MEPLFFKAENAAFRVAVTRRRRLQWSRFFSKRKISKRTGNASLGIDRFNGAAFFQSGKYSEVRVF